MGKSEGVRKRLSGALGLPGDVLLDMPVMRLEGAGRLICENHKGVLEYGDACIRFMTAAGAVCVRGRRLKIERFDVYAICVSGAIQSVEYIEPPRV